MTKPILPNVTLAAIVRDELINPAGGIEDFLDCTLPFIGAGVIIDTGSSDGTRDVLEEAKKRYSGLSIIDTAFEGYAQARNQSLEPVKTPYTLVLDADERLSEKDFKQLAMVIDQNKLAIGFNFSIENIYFDGTPRVSMAHHNPRLFVSNKLFVYRNRKRNSGEYLYLDGELCDHHCVETDVVIKHFKPNQNRINAKMNWRYSLNYGQIGKEPEEAYTTYLNCPSEVSPMRKKYEFGVKHKPVNK